MNEWAPAEENDGYRPDTSFLGILVFRANRRFVIQYLLLVICFSLPTILETPFHRRLQDWLLLPVGMLTAFGNSIWSMSVGLHLPLLFGLVHLVNPEGYSTALSQVLSFTPPVSQIAVGFAVSASILILALSLGIWLLKKNRLWANKIITIGGTLSLLLGSSLAAGSLLFLVIVSAGIGLLLLLSRSQIKSTEHKEVVVGGGLRVAVWHGVGGDAVFGLTFIMLLGVVLGLGAGLTLALDKTVAFIVALGLAAGMTVNVSVFIAISVRLSVWFNVEGVARIVVRLCALFVAFVIGIPVGIIVVGVLSGISTLPLLLFLLACWLSTFSLSPISGRWLGIIASGILIALGFEHLGWRSLLAVPVAFVGYYRLVPDFLVLTPISLWLSMLLNSRLPYNPLQFLRLLPPYTSELLWLPLPNHDRILAAAFRQDSSAALVTFQQMQTLPLPGFQSTIKKGLPQIVADQLAAVRTIPELLATAKPEHPLLPLLVPLFYQQNTELEEQLNLNTVSPVTKAVNRLLYISSVVLLTILMAGTLLILLDAFWAVLLASTFSAILGHITAETLLNDLSGNTEDGNDINKLVPRLQIAAKDVNAALETRNVALRERGLERILDNNLRMLQLQLPGLGLKVSGIKRWKPVIERWQRVIELELEEQQKQSQGELLNPFQYGKPLKRDRAYLFKGRQAFADNIVRLVLDRNRPTLVLHGPRRCGKSSFLLNLPRLLPSEMLPIYLDMQSAAVTTDEAAFCQGLVRAISKDSRSQGVELPAIPQRQEFLDTPYIALEDWLEQALPKLGDRRLLLNLDEFEKIGSAINQGRMSLCLFDELRHLIQHYDQLGFLFSGVQTLDELGPNWSSYFISVVPIEMLYLEPHEAEDLLVNPDPEFTLRYDSGIVEQILTLTHCQPYLLQVIGSSLVTLANERHTQLVTSDLLQASIPEALTNGQAYFTNVWTEFTGTSPTEVKAGQELLLALAQGHQPSSVASDETAQAARQRLLRYHVIEHINGSDRFEVPLIERWVRERAIRN